jgi:hypothetical protein
MSRSDRPTGFARLSAGAARVVLGITLFAMLMFGAISVSPHSINFADKPLHKVGDVDLYRAEIQRIAQGEGYYEAANAELRSRNYPTRSVFNWRTTLPMWLLGKLQSDLAGRAIIGVLAAVVLALSMHVASREGNLKSGFLCGLLLIGALMPCWLDKVYVLPVLWAGVLIALSIGAYAIDRRGWGVGLGLAALFLRELAAPYCLVCFCLAVIERRWREVTAWLIGLLAYGVFFAWHVAHVWALVGPDDRAHLEGWLQFGGAAFVLAVAQMNAFLLLLPQWVTAIYLPLAMLGFASNDSAAGRRAGLTACAFLILFAFVGQPFNQYWGALIAPLLCLGAAQGLDAIADLVRASFTGQQISSAIAES